MSKNASKTGKVWLVGAGPGDADLISVRGVNCLQNADAVIFDYLVNPRILGHVSKKCELISLGSHATKRVMPQKEINRRLVDLANEGKKVVRLKCGDPAVFARLAEELSALSAAKIEFEIVPGITAGFAAASIAGLPITDRASSSAVALVTGHERPDKKSSAIDFAALANFPGTIVIYMGTTTVDHWSTALMESGKSPAAPVLIVRRATFPDQSSISCTLAEVADRINQPVKVRPPVVFIIGEVANEANLHSWFEQRKLFGTTIMLCRPEHQSQSSRVLFEDLGAEIVVQPAIEIGPPNDWQPVDDAIERLSEFDWLVLSSSNGVDSFCNRLFDLGLDARSFGSSKIAAVGKATALRLKELGLVADLVPNDHRAESLVSDLESLAGGKRFLLIRANRGREVLRDGLMAAGGNVEQIVAYNSDDMKEADAETKARMDRGEIDWIVVSSSAIASSLHSMFGEILKKVKLASISPITSESLRELGHEPACEAQAYTIKGVRDAIVDCECNCRSGVADAP